ncbi:MAG: acyl-CoA dehydrogenase, partial [Hyphomicrobium sp.]
MKTAEQNLLSAGPEALLKRAEIAVASAEKILQSAKAGVRAAGDGDGGTKKVKTPKNRPTFIVAAVAE